MVGATICCAAFPLLSRDRPLSQNRHRNLTPSKTNLTQPQFHLTGFQQFEYLERYFRLTMDGYSEVAGTRTLWVRHPHLHDPYGSIPSRCLSFYVSSQPLPVPALAVGVLLTGDDRLNKKL
ncbi:hypothetical protein NDI52_29905 [Leptolyngbya sp. PL-A3]|uniref:hypothetical protein n=1 Tax=Leptolyngbya sp. PL-A3 TaxID=2933911 RepID=UPI0032992152